MFHVRAFLQSNQTCAFSTGQYHPHDFTGSLGKCYLFPSLEFDPTTTEAVSVAGHRNTGTFTGQFKSTMEISKI